MKFLWLLCLLIAGVILFTPISVRIFFHDDLDLKIKLLGITVYDYQKQTSDKKNKKEPKKTEPVSEKEQKHSVLEEAERVLKQIKIYFELLMQALEILKVYIQEKTVLNTFRFFFSFGLGDAALTGIYSGAAYAAVNCFYAYLLNNFRVKKHEIKVTPDFEKKYFFVLFELKLKISLFWILRLLYRERHVLSKLYILLKEKDGVGNVGTSN